MGDNSFQKNHTTHIVRWEYPSGVGVVENLSLMSRKRRKRRVTHTIRGCQVAGASLVAQMVRNLSAMQAWLRSLGWEDPLEKGVATHSSFLA